MGDRESTRAQDIYIGLQKDKWTVVDFIPGAKNPWKLKCVCGGESFKRSYEVRKLTGGCIKCRPQNNPTFEDIEEWGLTRIYGKYKRAAKHAEREFSLTKDEFRELIKSHCYYCGVDPSNKEEHRTLENYVYYYNGVDRIDSSAGYFVGNVFPACRPCNVAKMDRDVFEFAAWFVRVMEYQTEAKNQGWLSPINEYLIKNGMIKDG